MDQKFGKRSLISGGWGGKLYIKQDYQSRRNHTEKENQTRVYLAERIPDLGIEQALRKIRKKVPHKFPFLPAPPHLQTPQFSSEETESLNKTVVSAGWP